MARLSTRLFASDEARAAMTAFLSRKKSLREERTGSRAGRLTIPRARTEAEDPCGARSASG
jgi:hypothetical protein